MPISLSFVDFFLGLSRHLSERHSCIVPHSFSLHTLVPIDKRHLLYENNNSDSLFMIDAFQMLWNALNLCNVILIDRHRFGVIN